MKPLSYAAIALIAAIVLPGGHALANVCRAETLSCVTTMPIDGYCECRSHGTTEGGTVVSAAPSHHAINATSGGCGVNPRDPGCTGGMQPQH